MRNTKLHLWAGLAAMAFCLAACGDDSTSSNNDGDSSASSNSSGNDGDSSASSSSSGNDDGFAGAACSKAFSATEAQALLGVTEALDLTDTIRFAGLSNEQHGCSYNQYIVPEGQYFGEYNALDWTFDITTLEKMRSSYTAYTTISTVGDKHCVKATSIGVDLYFLYQDHKISSSIDAMRLWTTDENCVPDSKVNMQLYVNCQNTDFVATIDPPPGMDSLDLLAAYDELATKVCDQ